MGGPGPMVAQSSTASNLSAEQSQIMFTRSAETSPPPPNQMDSRKLSLEEDYLSEEEKAGTPHSDSPKQSVVIPDAFASASAKEARIASEFWKKTSPKRKAFDEQRRTFRAPLALHRISESNTAANGAVPSPHSLSAPNVTDLSPPNPPGDDGHETESKSPESIRVTFAEHDPLEPASMNAVDALPPNRRQDTLSPPTVSAHHSNQPSFDSMLKELKGLHMHTTPLSVRTGSGQSEAGGGPLWSLENGHQDAVLGVQNYTAQQIWRQSAMTGTRNNIAKYAALYPNLMEQFRKWTGITKRCPTRNQPRAYFVKFSASTNYKSSIELLMHSRDFEPFYQWFKAMSWIVKDFKCIYDSEQDVLSSLFCSKKQAKQKLTDCQEGTFLIRIGYKKGTLYISCKMEKGNVMHFKFTRIEDEIYQYGNVQSPIFQVIRCTKEFDRLYSAKSVPVTFEKKRFF